MSEKLGRMMKVQAHRGRDAEGVWQAQVGAYQVALGHLRLSILDLSPAGNQPMVSPDGRHLLIYNGELYNYKEMKEEMERLGVRFRSQCDTEVVLQSLMLWGEEALPRFIGMWAFAYLNLEQGDLLLSRDRCGIKPLYYYLKDHTLFFASEIKAILEGVQERFEINREAVGRYLLQSVQDAQEETFFAGIRALSAGHNLTFNLLDNMKMSLRAHWAFPEHDTFNGTVDERIEAVRETFVDAVRLRLRSDVPVGVLLSGGLDSSSIAAVMQKAMGRNTFLPMFSAVSHDPTCNELPFILRMEQHLACRAQKVFCEFQADQAFQLLETIIWYNDEPVISFSDVALYLLMERAKEMGVKVLLTGQGADELLCGYNKYLGFYMESLMKRGKLGKMSAVLSGFVRQGTVLPQFRFYEAKRYLPQVFHLKEIEIGGPRLQERDFIMDMGLGKNGVVHRQIDDFQRFSLPVLLHIEDRMSMAKTLETRPPFLDYRLIKLLLPCSSEWKMHDGYNKWIFRKAMENFFPPEIVWRKDKQGFTLPQSEWLKNKFRPYVESFFQSPMLMAESGFINQANLQYAYEVYCQQPAEKGKLWFKDIFNPLALEIWGRVFSSYLKFPEGS